MLAACARRNAVPGLLEPLGSRFDPSFPEDRPDRACRQLDSEPDQLSLDSAISPARVLLREPDDELADLGRLRRASGTPMRIRPAPRDQLTVPAQKRRRRHEG